jgi:hypothetical protein
LSFADNVCDGTQDWTELAGKVLCHACYSQFRTRGALERSKTDPLSGSARRCSYEGCKSPHQSRQFYQIDGWSVAGGQDWAGLAGRMLCESCYFHFYRKGTFDGTEQKVQPVVSTSLVQPEVSESDPSRKRPASHIDSCNSDSTINMGDNSTTEGAVKTSGAAVAIGIVQPILPTLVGNAGELVESSKRVKRAEEACTVLVGVVVDR